MTGILKTFHPGFRTPVRGCSRRRRVGDQLDSMAAKLGRQFPAVETMLRAPPSRWPTGRRSGSTNRPLERVNKEIERRTNVVVIFPNEAGVLRLAGSILLEVHDEWQVSGRRYLSEPRWRTWPRPTTMEPTTRRRRTKAKELLVS